MEDKKGKETLEVMNTATWYNKWLFQIIEPYLKGNILEIGSGIGNFSNYLKSKGNLYVSDINEDYVKSLKNLYKEKAGFGDIEKNKFFFKTKKFDSIVALNVLEHINDDSKAIENCSNLLTQGGRLIILVPAHKLLFSNLDKEIGHYRRYTTKDLKEKLLKLGFKIKIIRYLNWWAAVGWFVFLKMSKKGSMPLGPVKIFDFFGKIFISLEKYISFPFGLSVLAIAEKK